MSNCKFEQAIEAQSEKMDKMVKRYINTRPSLEEILLYKIGITLVNCNGDNGSGESFCPNCKGDCIESNVRNANIEIKENLRRSVFEHDHIVINKESELAQKFIGARVNEEILFRGGFSPGRLNRAKIYSNEII